MGTPRQLDRVFALVHETGVNDAEFAAAIGASSQTVANWKVRGRVPAGRMHRIAEWLSATLRRPITADYLYSGQAGFEPSHGSREDDAESIDTKILAGILAAIEQECGHFPIDSTKLADLIAQAYARSQTTIRSAGHDSIRAILAASPALRPAPSIRQQTTPDEPPPIRQTSDDRNI